MSFGDFVKELNPSHASATLDEKISYVFSVFDVNQQERISSDNFFRLLNKIVGDSVQLVQLQMLVRYTTNQNDKDGDGKLNYAEFSACLKQCSEMSSKLTVKF